MINRREMMAVGGGVLLSGTLGAFLAEERGPIYGGWLNLPAARKDFIARNAKPYFRQHQGSIKGTGQNKEVMLWKFYEGVATTAYVPHLQEIGDCTGQACGLGVDVLTTVQIGLHKKNEEWKGKCSTEAIYAGSRIEVGKGGACFDMLGRACDGSMGAWVAEYARDYGVLLRGQYGNVNLTKYNAAIAKKWGSSTRFGVPDDLERISKPHPVKTVTLVESWDQARDLVANGYPIVVCSGVGFQTKTDNDGFLNPGREPWYHAVLLWGIDTRSRRQGGCFANSWGSNWCSGPTHRLGTPPGSFWVDANVIDSMLKQGDSFALSNFSGYPKQRLDYRLW